MFTEDKKEEEEKKQLMKMMMKSVPAILLSLMLVMGLMTGMNMTAFAEDNSEGGDATSGSDAVLKAEETTEKDWDGSEITLESGDVLNIKEGVTQTGSIFVKENATNVTINVLGDFTQNRVIKAREGASVVINGNYKTINVSNLTITSGFGCIYGVSGSSMRINNLVLNGMSTEEKLSPLICSEGGSIVANNVYVEHARANSILGRNAKAILNNVSINDNLYYSAMGFIDSSVVELNDVNVDGCEGNGVQLRGSVCVLNNCDIKDADLSGINLNDGSTAVMNESVIEGCAGSGGIRVRNTADKFIMIGGSIEGCSSTGENDNKITGGISQLTVPQDENYGISIGADAKITGNTYGSETRNIYLVKDAKFKVLNKGDQFSYTDLTVDDNGKIQTVEETVTMSDDFTGEAGVSVEDEPVSTGNTVRQVTAATNSEDVICQLNGKGLIFSDKDQNSSGEDMIRLYAKTASTSTTPNTVAGYTYLALHSHEWNYAAGSGENADKIYAWCTTSDPVDCEYYGSGVSDAALYVALTAEDSVYNGSAYSGASISNNIPSVAPSGLATVPTEISYYNSTGEGSTEITGDALASAPTDAGNYVAQITWGGKTIRKAFFIKKTDSGERPASEDVERPAPEGVEAVDVSEEGESDGKVTGIDDSMEYSLDGGSTWTSVDTGQTELTGLPAYTSVCVRYKETDTSKASPYVTVTVGDSTARKVLVAKAVAKGSKKAVFSWNAVKGAANYELYLSKCNHNHKLFTPVYVKTFDSAKTSWTKGKLAKNTSYKFYVIAKNASGKQIAKSVTGHFITGNSKGIYTNPKNLKLSKTALTVSKGGTAKVKAKVSKVVKWKKLLGRDHTAKLRYITSNPGIATVNKKGVVTGVGTGSCTIYVQVVNGIWKKVSVTVE